MTGHNKTFLLIYERKPLNRDLVLQMEPGMNEIKLVESLRFTASLLRNTGEQACHSDRPRSMTSMPIHDDCIQLQNATCVKHVPAVPPLGFKLNSDSGTASESTT